MDDGIFVVTFEGSQTIEKSEKIKNILIDAIKGKKKEIFINISKIEKIDLSFLQLLYSASLEAISKKKKISISGDIPSYFRDMVRLSGFNRKLNQPSESIFSHLFEDEE